MTDHLSEDQLPNEDERLTVDLKEETDLLPGKRLTFEVDNSLAVKSMKADTDIDHYEIVGYLEEDNPRWTPPRKIQIFTEGRGASLGAGRVKRVVSEDGDFTWVAPDARE